MDAYNDVRQPDDYRRIEKAIRFIEDNVTSQPNLEDIARSVHLSKYHFDRMFKRWAGVSPMQFLQFLTLDYTKRMLAESESILGASLDVGLSGPGRLHDLFVTFEAMTPGDFKRQGAGLEISYGFGDTPFGDCLLAFTERGICHLSFFVGDRHTALEELFDLWPGALYAEAADVANRTIQRIFDIDRSGNTRPFHLLLKGTNFQVNVWKALLAIPEGRIVSYQDIAAYVGRPRAVRAVAHAVAVNPVAYLIPCHRVIRKSGKIHHYRWNDTRKKALIGWEAARTASEGVGETSASLLRN
jgi:AraC family transcriptional regulator of adaptative response/methylated-DNA-[protein]-cysteine methyltransferase